MYKYVIFDFNGTILDDVDLCLDLLNARLKIQGSKTLNKDEYKEVFGFPVKDYYVKAGIDFSQVSFETMAIEFIEHYQPRSLDCHLYSGVKPLIAYLKSKNISIGVLSASEINNLTMQLKHFGIYDEFDFVLGLDNIHAASKIEVGKTYLEEHHINPTEVLFLGDTNHDAEVAKALGATPILIAAGHQSHGILAATGAQVLDSLEEVLDII